MAISHYIHSINIIETCHECKTDETYTFYMNHISYAEQYGKFMEKQTQIEHQECQKYYFSVEIGKNTPSKALFENFENPTIYVYKCNQCNEQHNIVSIYVDDMESHTNKIRRNFIQNMKCNHCQRKRFQKIHSEELKKPKSCFFL